MCNCQDCLYTFTSKPKFSQPIIKERKFSHDGVIKSAKMKSYNDAFFEIVEGKYKGCLVHVWDIVK